MTRYGSGPATLSVLLAAILTSGCGSSRQLQSVSLSPATTDAQNYSNGQVPFTATGTFSKPPSPSPLTSKDVLWCVGLSAGQCAGNINPGATVDQNGVAQCVPAFVGTTYIMAGTAGTPTMNPDGSQPLKIFGTAQVTCP
jgi:hypothetical protein